MAGKTTNKAVSTNDEAAEGRASTKRTAKTPNDRPVAQVESAAPEEPTTMTEAEIAEANDEGGILRSDEPEVDAAEVAARQKQAKADARAAKKIDQAKADLRAVKEEVNPDALTLDDVADTSETEAQQDFSFDIRPDFQTMDQTGILDYMKHLTRWLRDRDAVVRGPKVEAHEVEDQSLHSITREGSTTPGAATRKTTTVYEGFYEWQYEDAPAITIRRVHVTELDALRDMANEAVVRRYEV